ncbi:MAG TPA: hypothetical protein DHU55_08170 [Blastocatellia bacterium]|jgi:uncharacterized LabA/DUF88 family protein|nr:hypothetical protein [Blastocatellia bacterium]HCX29732.1 hypothetical protein [Blastocatellia bacterium]
MAATQKWAMYIDGYNFYYAIKKRPDITPIHLAWCDFGALASEIIRSRGSLTRIKYFTAPVGDLGETGGEAGGERGRQMLWLRAVRTISHLEVVEGFHKGDTQRRWQRKEKQTDVNIAIALVLDAAKEFYERAILVTGDSDQMPAVRAASAEFARHIEVWLPPGQPKRRWSEEFDANRFVTIHSITPVMLERARLPDSIRHPGGTIEAPKMWRGGFA